MSARRILYLQYTNPAAYPPLARSATRLADAGWHVIFLGVRSRHVDTLALEPHPHIAVHLLGQGGTGWRRHLHYAWFCLWTLWGALRHRPHWIYASDVMAAPVALVLKTVFRRRVVLHEHDAYHVERPTRVMRAVDALFVRLARVSDVNVLPSDGRRARFRRHTGAPAHRCVRVFNCPLTTDVRPVKSDVSPGRLRMLFHGAIVPSRLPETLLDAMAALPDSVALRVIGYENAGSRGYVEHLRRTARRLNLESRVELLGPVNHHDLLALGESCDIGLACMPAMSSDVNMAAMAGASNKAFEYLACGLPLLVSDLPDWRALFVDQGYARPCDLTSPASIAEAVRWYLAHPGQRRAMGERGRQRILSEWNYEQQFAPVARLLDGA